MIVIIYFFVSGGQQSDGGGGLGFCGYILMFLSMIVIVCTLPFSLCLCIKVGNFDSGVNAVGQVDTYEPRHEISNNVVCATNKSSDQSAHTRSLIRAFASRLNIL